MVNKMIRKSRVYFSLFLLLYPFHLIFADYVLMGTYFDNPNAVVFKMSDSGEISFDYEMEVGGNPISIRFAPNGKWGLVGSHTTSYPHTQKTIVLGVDQNRKISVLGTAHNEYEDLLAISPDSRYGVYGADLKTLRFNNRDMTFTIIPTDNPILCLQADFSRYSNKILGQSQFVIEEYVLMDDGRSTDTGFTLDISPSDGYQDIKVSPDGKTCIALSIDTYEVTVLRILAGGGGSLVQQFNTDSRNPKETVFTPDSRYALIAFHAPGDINIISYSIGGDSKLTEIDSIILPDPPSDPMALTPDGKYIVTRSLVLSRSRMYVTEVKEDGTLEYLPENYFFYPVSLSYLAFAPPQVTQADGSWTWYE